MGLALFLALPRFLLLPLTCVLVSEPDPPHERVWFQYQSFILVCNESVYGQLSQLRGVRETTRRKVVVEGRDCGDWMAVDLGMVWYTQHN